MRAKFEGVGVTMVILQCLIHSYAQDLSGYCNNSRFDTTDIFNDAQLMTSDAVFRRNTNWEGNVDTLHLSLYYPGKQFDTLSARPLIALIHGGGFLTGSYLGEKEDEKYFARKGFVK